MHKRVPHFLKEGIGQGIGNRYQVLAGLAKRNRLLRRGGVDWCVQIVVVMVIVTQMKERIYSAWTLSNRIHIHIIQDDQNHEYDQTHSQSQMEEDHPHHPLEQSVTGKWMTIDRHAIQYEKVSLGTLLESQLPDGYVCMKNGLVIPDNYRCLQLPIPPCPSYSFASACIHHQDSDIDIRLEINQCIRAGDQTVELSPPSILTQCFQFFKVHSTHPLECTL